MSVEDRKSRYTRFMGAAARELDKLAEDPERFNTFQRALANETLENSSPYKGAFSDEDREQMQALKDLKIRGAAYTLPHEDEAYGEKQVYPGLLYVFLGHDNNINIISLLDPSSTLVENILGADGEHRVDLSRELRGGNLRDFGLTPVLEEVFFDFANPEGTVIQVKAEQWMTTFMHRLNS